MILDENINYIISGLERSGTSMLMQIIHAGGLPISYDDSRPADENNPKGYYELEGGKIISKLIDGKFQFKDHKAKFIKITAFGLKYLPPGNYKIIYSERNIEEILDSMEKMIGQKDNNREETKMSFIKLNNIIKQYTREREDMDVLLVNYNKIISNPKENIERIVEFLGLSNDVQDKMINAVDNKLYRQRRI
jgi:hypothetical protein